ncbi:MAG: imidazole glycerol phosphate synthase subunit HisH [Bacteroidales bacterium]|nr:imidazole glycerol phosphate synthase subunit HisH [Bacteroidales bacterium]
MIAIIDYGAGNVQSVRFALERLGKKAVLTKDLNEIMRAEKVIFPGVGEAQSAMKALKSLGLDNVIPQLTQPVLGICLGMQLLCEASEEGKTKALGIFSIKVKRFGNELKVPQIGWNHIWNLKSKLFKGVDEKSFMYFVHSYYIPENEYSIANSDYGINFSAAIQKNNFYACQFHPEKSGNVGQIILENFLKL